MAFEIESYTKIWTEFLFSLTEGSDYSSLRKALPPLCQFLGIGRCEIISYRSEEHVKRDDGVPYDLYDVSPAEGCEVLSERLASESGIIDIVVSGTGDRQWSDEEKEKIRLLQSVMLMKYDQISSKILSEKFMFRDRELGFFTMPFVKKEIRELLAAGTAARYTACYFNLCRFGAINQMMERHEANSLMIKFANHVERCCGEGGIVARSSGDNFVALCRNERLAEVRQCLFGTDLEFGGGMVRLSARAGAYQIGADDSDPNEIMDNANRAFRETRRAGAPKFIMFNSELRRRQEQKEFVEARFQEALGSNEFRVYYQPKVNLKNYSLAGGEALCRWFHNGMMIPPDQFIPILEQNTAICDLDFYVLDRVCRDIRSWLDGGKPVVRISVNLSRQHLTNVNLFHQIMGIIDGYNIPHNLIEIELTETTTDVGFNDMRNIVEPLSREGIGTSIDDFGCGYSSLNLMRELPWSTLKIDKTFLYGKGSRGVSEAKSVLHHVISMAQEHGLECIVEGIETLDHVQLLKENGCFLAQGYYFDRPLNKEDFEKRLMAKGSGGAA